MFRSCTTKACLHSDDSCTEGEKAFEQPAARSALPVETYRKASSNRNQRSCTMIDEHCFTAELCAEPRQHSHHSASFQYGTADSLKKHPGTPLRPRSRAMLQMLGFRDDETASTEASSMTWEQQKERSSSTASTWVQEASLDGTAESCAWTDDANLVDSSRSESTRMGYPVERW
eukprot:gnl/MRDRNA2_/MRDRNA2_116316_c0_seq1.p1 gnl/MRDRNA2_/MRDRNA2_116316_c0~~gnl/MRDRNA2_/MRDRNA2_116316_c0_seq1.p1  ORF type:complete len:174 (-),score=25.63 gnl/MRDRNA2_/MRDRNA2_116316_c0_seq1:410-931(-)